MSRLLAYLLVVCACGGSSHVEPDGAPGVDGDAGDVDATLEVDAPGGGPLAQGAYLKASNTGSLDSFGWAIALSADGTTLAVGAYDEDSGAVANPNDNSAGNAGAVYIYTRAGETWSFQAYVKASNPGIGAGFGNALALSADGSVLAVGAPYEKSGATGIDGDQTDTSTINAGAVYTFRRAGTTWTQDAYVKASNTGFDDIFGYSVSLSDAGTTLAVGAYDEAGGSTNQADDSAEGAGAVYVFTRPAVTATWTQQAYLKASNVDAGDSFGFAVDLSGSGDTLAVGAYHEASAATGVDGDQTSNTLSQAGATYVFTRSGTTWTQDAYLKSSTTTGVFPQRFGWHLALAGDAPDATLAVTAQGDFENGGAVHVFMRDAAGWTPQAVLLPADRQRADWFGFALGIAGDGDTLFVGAPQEDSAARGVDGDQLDNTVPDTGAAYVFTRSGATWTQAHYLKASNGDQADVFGYFVAMSADASTFAVGAPREASAATGVGGDELDNSAPLAGAVYVFR